MDEEFAKALDTLHSRVDPSIQKSFERVPVTQSTWSLDEPVPKKEPMNPTYFLLVIFLFVFVCVAAGYVYLYWKKDLPREPTKPVEPPNHMELQAAEIAWLEAIKNQPLEPAFSNQSYLANPKLQQSDANLASQNSNLPNSTLFTNPTLQNSISTSEDNSLPSQPKPKVKKQKKAELYETDSEEDAPIDVEELVRKREAQTKVFETNAPPPN